MLHMLFAVDNGVAAGSLSPPPTPPPLLLHSLRFPPRWGGDNRGAPVAITIVRPRCWCFDYPPADPNLDEGDALTLEAI